MEMSVLLATQLTVYRHIKGTYQTPLNVLTILMDQTQLINATLI